ncbi:condensation domain-containing protein [Nonomuraea sp. NPDC049129]|uniref:condensation domain-containing protein n=1 Tax=Nonomuraea sp. NPDC049129 TaxID=3155272 RepID=UPI0033EB0357
MTATRIVRRGPLAWSQQALFFFSSWSTQDDPWPALVLAYQLDEPRSMTEIRAALANLASRHEILRTRIRLRESGEAEQLVSEPPTSDDIPVTQVPEQEDEDSLRRFRDRLRWEPPSLNEAHLWKAHVVGGRTIFLTLHHILTDGTGVTVLGGDLAALLNPDGEPVTGPAYQPLDQADWESSVVGEKTGERSLNYIGNLLDKAPQRLFSRLLQHAGGDRYLMVTIGSAALLELLDQACRRLEVKRQTMLAGLLSAFITVRWGQAVCPMKSYMSNRTTPASQTCAGPLYQAGFLLLEAEGDPLFTDWLAQVQGATMRAYARSRYPDEIYREMVVRRSFERGVYSRFLFDINFLRGFGGAIPERTLGEPVEVNDIRMERTVNSAGLPEACEFMARIVDDELVLTLDVDQVVFDATSVDLIFHGMITALDHIVRGASPTLTELGALAGVHPIDWPAGWVQSDGCWVDLPDLTRNLLDHPLVDAAFVEHDEKLTAYVSSTAAELTPFDMHDHLLGVLAYRPGLICPDRYVVCDSPPVNTTAASEWRARPVVREGSGRDVPDRRASNGAEKALLTALRRTHDLSDEPSMAHSYVGAGGRIGRVAAFVEAVHEQGYTGLTREDFIGPASLRSIATRLRSC